MIKNFVQKFIQTSMSFTETKGFPGLLRIIYILITVALSLVAIIVSLKDVNVLLATNVNKVYNAHAKNVSVMKEINPVS